MRAKWAVAALLGLSVTLVTTVPVASKVGAEKGGRPIEATMTGAQEVPGPGDPDGSGEASITLNRGLGQVCWDLTARDITLPAAAAHIHRGPEGVAGPIEVTLSPPGEDGTSSGCTTADHALIDEIRHDPAAFYVNVHTSDFPGGAIRGQLSK